MAEASYIPMLSRWGIVALAGVAIIAAPAVATADDTEEFGASISISLPLEINEQDPIDFGQIGRPSNQAATITLDWDGGGLEVDGEQVVAEDGQEGRYHIQGPSGEEAQVHAEIHDFGVAEIETVETHIEGEDSTTTVEFTGNPGGGGGNNQNPLGPPVNIGGVVRIHPGVPFGQFEADLVIIATQE